MAEDERRYVSSGYFPMMMVIGVALLVAGLIVSWAANSSAWSSEKASVFLAAVWLVSVFRILQMGLVVADDRLVLRYFFHRRVIARSSANRFELQRAGSVRLAGQFQRVNLVLTGDRSIRVPTLILWDQSESGWRRSWSRLVWNNGTESSHDVLGTLNQIISNDHQEMRGGVGP